MEQHCIRHTEIPGASRLFADLLYHYDRVERFYPHAPYEPESLETVASGMLYPAQRRSAIVAALREQNPGNASLEALAQEQTVAIVTGQQVGLFGGPLYSLFKALSAAKLAQTLTARGICAVPVFWLATEDHDLAEVNLSWALNREDVPVPLRTASSDPGAGPVGPVALRGTPLEELRSALSGLPFAEEACGLISECYANGESFGSAFRKLFGKLLEPFGVLFLDPLAPPIRTIAAPFLARALGQSKDLVRTVQQRSQELEIAGYHAQVHLEGTASLLFRLQNGHRISLKRTSKGFNDWTYEELAAQPELLSPNAVLRPVLQDYLLPTAAYVGGPAELAYLAQSEPLYRSLLGRMPVAMHRASFTLLDGRGAKLMDRYGLNLPDLAVPDVVLRERMAAKLVPPDLAAKFANARQQAASQMDALSGAVEAFDPTLRKAIANSAAKVKFQFEKLEKKAAREALRRDQRAQADAEYLHHLIYPHRHLQERFYGIAPFLARFGMDLPRKVFECIRPECPDHQVLTLD